MKNNIKDEMLRILAVVLFGFTLLVILLVKLSA